MIALASLCLASSLGVALIILLAARTMGWRRRIGMLVRPWLLAILIMLTFGLADAAANGIAALSSTGWIVASAWLAVSLVVHLVGWRTRRPDPARLWGARIAHAGIAITLGGILLSSAFTSTVQRSLAPGETLRLDDWTVQLHDVWPAAGDGWTGVSAELRASSGDGVVILEPKQKLLDENMTIFELAQLKSGSGLLIARLGPRDGEGRWPITVSWTPLLVLMPTGLLIALLGLIVAVIGPDLMRWRRLRQARLATAWWA